MSGQTVFVIEDDDDARVALGRLLRSQGFPVTPYGSADEFLRTEQFDRPGCIVSDLRLPGTDGLDLFEVLQSSGRLTPMIFLSAYRDVPASVRAMKKGAVDFLVKPVDADTLFDSVNLALALDTEIRQQKSEKQNLGFRLNQLTFREQEVFALVVGGWLNKQIAAHLGISEQTVKVHRGRVMKKMGAVTLPELVHFAERLGRVQPSANPLVQQQPLFQSARQFSRADRMDSKPPSLLVDRLLRINAECARIGEEEASYHLLMAAMLVADDKENLADLDRVIVLARLRANTVERKRPRHEVARAAASVRPADRPSRYDLLITRATSARAHAVTRDFRRQLEAAKEPVAQQDAPLPATDAATPPDSVSPDPDRTSTRSEKLIEVGRDCFNEGVFEAAFHVLMAAVHSAEATECVSDLDNIIGLANQQADAIDRIVPPHRLSRAAAAWRKAPAVFDLLIDRAEFVKARLLTLRFRGSRPDASPSESGETQTA